MDVVFGCGRFGLSQGKDEGEAGESAQSNQPFRKVNVRGLHSEHRQRIHGRMPPDGSHHPQQASPCESL